MIKLFLIKINEFYILNNKIKTLNIFLKNIKINNNFNYIFLFYKIKFKYFLF